jgi:hypothetical protein
MPQNMSFWIQWSGWGTFIAKNSDAVLVQPVLYRLSCSNKTVRNAPKHEFWVQRSGSDALVMKFSDVTSFGKLVRQ